MQMLNGDMELFKNEEEKEKLIQARVEQFEKLKAEAEAEGKPIPKISKTIPIFSVGEFLEIKGGRFMVQSIGKSAMVLKSMPNI